MESTVRKLLDGADDPAGCEWPLGRTDAERALQQADVEAIQLQLARELGIHLDRDGNQQDATFLADLFVLKKTELNPGTWAYFEFAIRFSNFGKLFTVWTCLDEIPSGYPVARIIEVITGRGWHYIPPDNLRVEYDGANEVLRQAQVTWWQRFFDSL